ncbi:hypothetical protein E2C01_091363 [Portunus trituberculatus]|uniref:Uncharacterized protein n=1 Tax=Portunus trituberculatus TaxID=210409 RepID=A0A5B7JIV7_PORTR|nr:hypothetical protein [Portunus trituberculatus]
MLRERLCAFRPAFLHHCCNTGRTRPAIATLNEWLQTVSHRDTPMDPHTRMADADSQSEDVFYAGEKRLT